MSEQQAMTVTTGNAAAAYLASLSNGSRRTMRECLDHVAALLTDGVADARSMDWTRVERSHGLAVRSILLEREHLSPATVNKHLSALRGVLRESWRAGYLSSEQYQRASDLPMVKAERLPRGRGLASGEIAALMQACAADSLSAGVRDAAIIALAYAGGLRRSEVVALDVDNYDTANGEIRILSGKGNKDRLLYIDNGAKDALDDWLTIRGPQAGPLFYRIRRGGHIVAARLTDQSIAVILSKRAQQAGVKATTPHDLRRSMIGDLLDAGNDLATVQRIVGHSSPTTTARYDRRGNEAMQRAAKTLHVPYRPLLTR